MIITISLSDVSKVASQFPEKNTVYRYDDKAIYFAGAPDNDTSDARVYIKDNSIIQAPIELLKLTFDTLFDFIDEQKEDEILDIFDGFDERISYEIVILSEDINYKYDYKHNFIPYPQRKERISVLEDYQKIISEYKNKFIDYYKTHSKSSEFKVDLSRAQRIAKQLKSNYRKQILYGASLENSKKGLDREANKYIYTYYEREKERKRKLLEKVRNKRYRDKQKEKMKNEKRKKK